MSQVKTNVMRILDTKKISYTIMNYDAKDGQIDGISVPRKLVKNRNLYIKH